MVNKEFIELKIDEALKSFKIAKYRDAIKILENLKEKNSNFLINWYLGHSYFRIYDYLSAIKFIKRSIELKGPDELNQSFLGEILLESNQHEESIKVFNNILKINKINKNALFNLAKIYSDIGKFSSSEQYYNKILEDEPQNFKALYELIKINKNYLDSNKIKNLKNFKEQNNLNDVYASFILAENNKKKKNYKEEIDNLLKGHSDYLKTKKKASEQEFNYFTNLLPKFSKKVKDANIQLSCEYQPIFVMGLPRSGTTMIENLITNNDNKISRGDETGVMGKTFYSKQIITNYDHNDLNTNFNFNKNDFKNLKKSIFDQYKQVGIDISNGLFTDKSLENFLYIDILEKIFPKAKFIYCKRNNVANLLGILKVFLPNLLWCHSLEKIMKFIDLYKNKLTEILSEKKINIKIIEIENFSNDPLSNSKDLFNFLGIKWNEDVLNINFNQQAIIKTVSNIQVRNKIFKHDLSYLKNYIPLLEKYGIKNLI